MTDVVEKMAVAHFAAMVGCDTKGVYIDEDGLRGMRAALEALAESVNDEMVKRALDLLLQNGCFTDETEVRRAIRAAILAAKG